MELPNPNSLQTQHSMKYDQGLPRPSALAAQLKEVFQHPKHMPVVTNDKTYWVGIIQES